MNGANNREGHSRVPGDNGTGLLLAEKPPKKRAGRNGEGWGGEGGTACAENKNESQIVQGANGMAVLRVCVVNQCRRSGWLVGNHSKFNFTARDGHKKKSLRVWNFYKSLAKDFDN